MSKITKIPWATSTINFWSGCTNKSAGCAHCYAEARDAASIMDFKVCGITDPKGADPAEWPADLRVREWPEGF